MIETESFPGGLIGIKRESYGLPNCLSQIKWKKPDLRPVNW